MGGREAGEKPRKERKERRKMKRGDQSEEEVGKGSLYVSLRGYIVSRWGPSAPQAPLLQDHIQLGFEAPDFAI